MEMSPNCTPAETLTPEATKEPEDAFEEIDESLAHMKAKEAERPRPAFCELDCIANETPNKVTETEPLVGEKATFIAETAGESNDAALEAIPICLSLERRTSIKRNLPDGTLFRTLDEEIHDVILADERAMTSLVETSLHPKKLPMTVTKTPPDVGKLPRIKCDGLDRPYDKVWTEKLAC